MTHAPGAERRADDRVCNAFRLRCGVNVLGDGARHAVSFVVIGRDLVGHQGRISVEVALREARFDKSYADSKLAHLVIHGLRHPLDGVLGGRIEPHIGGWKEPEHRTDIDDPAGALRTHVRQNSFAGAQDAENVGVEHRHGLGNRAFFRRPEHGHPGIVDQHVDVPGSINDGLDAVVYGVVVANIHFDQFDPGQWLCLGDAAHRTEYLASLLGKLLCGNSADAR